MKEITLTLTNEELDYLYTALEREADDAENPAYEEALNKIMKQIEEA